jgi:hypothetical protein
MQYKIVALGNFWYNATNMKYFSAVQKKAPYMYLILLLIGMTLVTFIDAGYTFYPVTIWAFFMIPLCFSWFLSPKKNWKLFESYKPLFIVYLLFVLFVFIGYFFKPYADFGYKDFILFFSVFVIFFTSTTIKWEKTHLRLIFRSLCVIAFALSAYGIYRYIAFPFDRVTGPFFLTSQSNVFFPNGFSFFLVLIIPLQILYLFNQTTSEYWNFRKVYFYLSTIVISTAFFLCFSRASLIALFILSVIFIILQLSHAMKKKALFHGKSIQVLLVILIISFITISGVNWARSYNYEVDSFEAHFDLDATESRASFFERFNYMKVAGVMALDYPLFGIGSNNYEYFYPEYRKDNSIAYHPHNLMLKLASENGILSSMLAVVAMILLLYYYFKNKNDIEQKYYAG